MTSSHRSPGCQGLTGRGCGGAVFSFQQAEWWTAVQGAGLLSEWQVPRCSRCSWDIRLLLAVCVRSGCNKQRDYTVELLQSTLATFLLFLVLRLRRVQCLELKFHFNHSLLYIAVPWCRLSPRCRLQQVNWRELLWETGRWAVTINTGQSPLTGALPAAGAKSTVAL